MAIIGQVTLDQLSILEVDADPTIAATAAAIGSTAYLFDGVNGKMWIKSGSGDTAWSIVMRQASGTAFSAGAIPYADASGYLVGNTGRIYWDATNNRLSIGANAPATPQSSIHIDRGNATGGHIRMTAGTTTGVAAGDGTEFGIDDAGNAEIRQYENSNINFYTQNTIRGCWAPNGQLLIGSTTPIDITGASAFPPFQIIGTGAVQMVGVQYSNDTIGPVFNILKSRGATVGAQGALTLNDEFGRHQFRGSDGTNFTAGASIRAFVDGTVSTGVMPGRLELMTTPAGSGTPVTQLLINNTGLGIWTSAIRLGTTTDTTAGNLRYTGTTFEGYVGGAYRDLINIVNGEINSSSTITTTSATDVVLTGFTTTPAAGTYIVMFSGNYGSSSAGAEINTSLYVAAAQQAHTTRQCTPNAPTVGGTGDRASMGFHALVTVNGSQAVDVRWSRTAGTASCFDATMTWFKVNI